MKRVLFWLTFCAVFVLSANVEAIRNDPDLIIYSSFDKDEKEVTDDGGNGFDAEISGVEWSKEGKLGGAMEFDGGSAIKTQQDIPGLTDADLTEMTVEHWVMLSAITGDTQQVWEALNTAGAWPAETFIEGAGAMVFYIYDTKNTEHRTEIPELPTKKWVHIAGTYDGKVQKSYFNGKVVAEEAWSGKFRIFNAPTGAIVLGKDNEADIQHLNGFIDEFAFYMRALSEDEINADMNKGVLFAVDPADKLSTTWANIKAGYYPKNVQSLSLKDTHFGKTSQLPPSS